MLDRYLLPITPSDMMPHRSPAATGNGRGRTTLPLLPTNPTNRSAGNLLRRVPPPTALRTVLQSKPSNGSSSAVASDAVAEAETPYRSHVDRVALGNFENRNRTLPLFLSPRNGMAPAAIDAPPLVPPRRLDHINKGPWSREGDRHLIRLVREYDGAKIRWTKVATAIGNRAGKQCRERWHNHLRPDIKKDNWSKEEELLLVTAHRKIGNKWAKLARQIPGRSENAIKNHWNATKKKLLSKMSAPRRKFPIRQEHTVLRDYISSIVGLSYNTPSPSLSSSDEEEEEEEDDVTADANYNGLSSPANPAPPSSRGLPATARHHPHLAVQYRCPNCFYALPQGFPTAEVNYHSNYLPNHDETDLHERLNLPPSLNFGYSYNQCRSWASPRRRRCSPGESTTFGGKVAGDGNNCSLPPS